MPMATRIRAVPSTWALHLAGVAAAVAAAQGVPAPVPVAPAADAEAVAKLLLAGERKAVLLGNAAAQHPHDLRARGLLRGQVVLIGQVRPLRSGLLARTVIIVVAFASHGGA